VSLLFEFPLNERIRLMLRIEYVLNRVQHYLALDDAASHHTALLALFEFLELANSRSDMKSEVLQEMERQRAAVQSFRSHEGADDEMLDALLAEIETTFKALQNNAQRIAQSLREDEWLMSVYTRSNVAGGTCSFDLPSYHAWLHLPTSARQQAIQLWLAPTQSLQASVQLILRLLRDSYPAKPIVAVKGAYQHDMRNKTYQLARLWLPADAQAIPEISANKYGVWIRLLTQATQVKTAQVERDITLKLAMCML
jgi:cell division protein ZapD